MKSPSLLFRSVLLLSLTVVPLRHRYRPVRVPASPVAVSTPQEVTPNAAPDGIPAARWQEIQQSIATDQRAFRSVTKEPGISHRAEHAGIRFQLAIHDDGAVNVGPAAPSALTEQQRLSQQPTTVVNRQETPAEQWKWQVRPLGIGRGVAMESLMPPQASSMSGQRVELSQQAGKTAVTSWIENASDGMKQGWNVIQKPSGDGRLELTVALATDLQPRVLPGGQEVRFANASGQDVVTWDKLVAKDASGRLLPGELCLEAGNLIVSVDDSAAQYPISIDPRLHRLELTLLAGDAEALSYFGGAVALCGNRLAVGQSNATVNGLAGAGAVYIYDQSSATPQIPIRKIVAPVPSMSAGFGASLASQGEELAIGSYGANLNGDFSGGVYFYNINSASGGPDDILPGPGQIVYTGSKMVWQGPLLAVTGNREPGHSDSPGVVYIYERGPTNLWVEAARLSGPNGLTLGGSQHFGAALALQDDVLVIGFPGANSSGNQTGRADFYKLMRSGNGRQPVLVHSINGTAAMDQLGTCVAASGGIYAVGAPGFQLAGSAPGSGSGRVTILHQTTNGIELVRTLVNPDPSRYSIYGSDVAMLGETMVAATTGSNQSLQIHCKNLGGEDGWGISQALEYSSASIGGYELGASMALDRGRLLVGAPGSFNVADSGAALLFKLEDCGWTYANGNYNTGGAPNSQLGKVIAAGGNTAAASAPAENIISIMRRNGIFADDWRTVLVKSVSLADVSPHIGAVYTVTQLGRCLAMDGDLLAAGAHFRNDSQPSLTTGGVIIFDRNYGGAGAWGVMEVVFPPTGADASFGTSVALQNNTLVVGAPENTRAGLTSAGTAYVFNETAPLTWSHVATLMPKVLKQTIPPITSILDDSLANARFGSAVAICGDRIVVTARTYQTSTKPQVIPEGMAYSYLRNTDGADAWGWERRISHANMEALGEFGATVAMHGEWLVIGAPGEMQWETDPAVRFGSAWVWRVRGNQWGAPMRIEGQPTEGVNFGQSVAVLDNLIAVGQGKRGDFGDHVMIYESGWDFAKNQAGWLVRGRLVPPPAASSTALDNGRSVALVPGACLIGSPGWDSGRGSVSAWIPQFCGPWSVAQFGSIPNDTGMCLESETLLATSPNSASIRVYDRNQDGPDAWGLKQSISIPVDVEKPSLKFRLRKGWLAVGDDQAVQPSLDTTGTVHIYKRDGSGNFVSQKKLFPPNTVVSQKFGAAVDVDGERVIVGAPDYSNVGSGLFAQGRVYVYERNIGGADAWGLASSINPGTTFGGEKFGKSVALGEDFAAVSAPGYPFLSGNFGRVFIVRRDIGGGSLWTRGPSIDAPVAQRTAGAVFGQALSLSGPNLAIMGEDYVVIHERHNSTAADSWALQTEISNIAPNSISLSGSRLAISRTDITNAGWVDMRERNHSGLATWGSVQSIYGPYSTFTQFAQSVELSETTLAVTSPNGIFIYRPYPSDYLLWAETYGLPFGNNSPIADFDGDGASNLQECALGSNPLDRSSRNDPKIYRSGNRLSVAMLLADRCTRFLSFHVQGTNDLLTWADLDEAASPYTSFDGYKYELDDTQPISASPRRFLRVRFDLLPAQ